jgi:hypothetical protein
LGFVDISDAEPSDRDETSADAVGVEHEHGAEGPDAERSEEGVGFEIALYEIFEVSCVGQSEWGEGYRTPRSMM